jgi:hypothetical protein
MVEKIGSPIVGTIEAHKKPTFLMVVFIAHTLQCAPPFVVATIISLT